MLWLIGVLYTDMQEVNRHPQFCNEMNITIMCHVNMWRLAVKPFLMLCWLSSSIFNPIILFLGVLLLLMMERWIEMTPRNGKRGLFLTDHEAQVDQVMPLFYSDLYFKSNYNFVNTRKRDLKILWDNPSSDWPAVLCASVKIRHWVWTQA